jgi:YidC/Oxa1 family membrane protein insertase
MTNEKRFVLFVAIVFVWMLAVSSFSRMMGWTTPPKRIPPAEGVAEKVQEQVKQGKLELAKAEALGDAAKPAVEKAKDERKNAGGAALSAAPPKQEIEIVKSSELVLGSLTDKTERGYRLEAQLEQKGAGIESVYSSRYDAELDEKIGRWSARKRPLELISRDTSWPPSVSLTLSRGNGAAPAAEAGPAGNGEDEAAIKNAAVEAEDLHDRVTWEVVRENGRCVRSIKGVDPVTNAPVEGQAVVFRTTAPNGVVMTKTISLFPNRDGLEVELRFESPDKERTFTYYLCGPHGIPIEGEWYTGTFRDVIFGQVKGPQQTDVQTHSASDVVSATSSPIDNTALPLAFAGVENQYFAILIEPNPTPTGDTNRWDAKTVARVIKKDEKATQKSDVGIQITSKTITVGPNQPVVHNYRVFAGPKTVEALKPYGAEGLATYRKNQWIPLAPTIARFVITPILGFTYNVTERVARAFGGIKGNYGIAIILLTMLVRALMFPIGRKQALAAQKMQQLQPHLKELQEKYKDDKEKLTKEQLALYSKHGVNPVAGCLPALIQLPIFVGLWQALNTSFPLRHATFLWIRDLSAPDMLFRFPFEIPLVGSFLGNWFNALPFVVVGLMLVQTKLFSPPATTPEAEMQQRMMKFMMIFMAFMFYKVPSGLGIYFITSSLWAIGERLLLPKITHADVTLAPAAANGDAGQEKGWKLLGGRGGTNGDGSRGGGKTGGDGSGPKTKAPGRFAQFLERVLEEAQKDATIRRESEEREAKVPERERDRDRPRPKPRRR